MKRLLFAILLLSRIALGQQTGLTATPAVHSMNLSWTLPAPGFTMQRLFRGFTPGGEDYTNIFAVVGPTVTTYVDSGGYDGETMYYTAETCTGSGMTATCSAPSAEASAVYPTAGRPSAQLPTGCTASGSTYSCPSYHPTYSLPVGGTTFTPLDSASFRAALTNAVPGDVIVLAAGTTYTGLFNLPAKTNPSHKWIYIISSAEASLPPPGTRVNNTTNPANMPKIVTTNVAAAVQWASGADHWWFSGIEIYSASTAIHYGRNGYTFFLAAAASNFVSEPDSIVFDRCYIHGSPSIDIQHGVIAQASNFYMIDSWMDEIHFQGADSNGVAAYNTPGPVGMTNNYVSAASEGFLLGGAGNNLQINDFVAQYNYFFKPLSWVPLSLAGFMTVKNGVEVKGGSRGLIDSNTIQNAWVNGQYGPSIALTPRPSGGGSYYVNDITVTNNVAINVVSFMNDIASDYYCGVSPYIHCLNAGSQDNWVIVNNFASLWDIHAPGIGSGKNFLTLVNGGYNNAGLGDGVNVAHYYIPLRDVLWQHNTTVPIVNGQNCWGSIYASVALPAGLPVNRLSNNLWILDNGLCNKPSGDSGNLPSTWMNFPTTAPNAYANRFTGDEIYAQGGALGTWPAGVLSTNTDWTTTLNGNNVITNPVWASPNTTDGVQAGYEGSNFIIPVSYNTPLSFANCVVGIPYTSVTANCSGGTPPYTWSLIAALPSGMSLNASTGVIGGTCTTPGVSMPNIKCTDTLSAFDTSGPINFTTQAAGSSLTYNVPTSLVNAAYLAAYGPIDITASGGTAPYTCNLQAGTLPAGIALSTGPTGINCRLSSASVTGSVMVYPGIVFRVTDSAAATADSPSLSLTVLPSAPDLGIQVSQGTVILKGTAFQ